MGTSGEKVPINGGINVSILDGWWVEGYRGDDDWAIGDGKADDADSAVQDARDAESLYKMLESEVSALQHPPHGARLRDRELPARGRALRAGALALEGRGSRRGRGAEAGEAGGVLGLLTALRGSNVMSRVD